MTFSRAILSSAILAFLFVSCGETKNQPSTDSVLTSVKPDSPKNAMASMPVITSQNIEAKTFEVIDSLGKHKGWGYDLYIDGKRSIHQPIIPAVPGNDAFATEADAKKTGDLAANIMKTTGSLPTISIHNLDSLGVKHK